MSEGNLFSRLKRRLSGNDDEFMIGKDKHIESMTNNYLSIIDQGLDLYEFKPEPPTGTMATNRYAQESYTRQLIAFSRAIVTIPIQAKGQADE